MIKQLTGTDLASSKTRSGMSSLGELLPRLIRSYELQAELMKKRAENVAIPTIITSAAGSPSPAVQATFSWYE